MQEYRKKFRHLLQVRKANRTPKEIAESRLKSKLYQRQYRKEHAEEIKARKALLPLEVKKERAERSKLRTQKSRLKKRLANPQTKRLIPLHRVKRNADRKQQRDADPDFKTISMHITRVNRVRKKLKGAEVTGKVLDEAKKAYAIAFVNRFNLMVSLGRTVKDTPTREQFDLAAPVVEPEDDEISSSDDEEDGLCMDDILDSDDEELFVDPLADDPDNHSDTYPENHAEDHPVRPQIVTPWTMLAVR
ncbi:hypothetical protein Plec18167_001585 [Paecilomyces lecythidis]|uniref:Uncharacterized protein n=1 Tax=Paecilomyces lecythidis TaxID=3004212 RepID=A0ABR3YA02_9EURO